MFWGTLADRMGRRPTSLGCLFVLSLACIGLALVPTSYFWLLMVFRCIQAVGSASTLTIGAPPFMFIFALYLIRYRCWYYCGHRDPRGARWFLRYLHDGSTGEHKSI
jgi:MFS family permease